MFCLFLRPCNFTFVHQLHLVLRWAHWGQWPPCLICIYLAHLNMLIVSFYDPPLSVLVWLHFFLQKNISENNDCTLTTLYRNDPWVAPFKVVQLVLICYICRLRGPKKKWQNAYLMIFFVWNYMPWTLILIYTIGLFFTKLHLVSKLAPPMGVISFFLVWIKVKT